MKEANYSPSVSISTLTSVPSSEVSIATAVSPSSTVTSVTVSGTSTSKAFALIPELLMLKAEFTGQIVPSPHSQFAINK